MMGQCIEAKSCLHLQDHLSMMYYAYVWMHPSRWLRYQMQAEEDGGSGVVTGIHGSSTVFLVSIKVVTLGPGDRNQELILGPVSTQRGLFS